MSEKGAREMCAHTEKMQTHAILPQFMTGQKKAIAAFGRLCCDYKTENEIVIGFECSLSSYIATMQAGAMSSLVSQNNKRFYAIALRM